jgi:Mn2+/Fe2+ NRAMP family transporter
MSGRFAAVSKHTIIDAVRERFGFNFFVYSLLPVLLVTALVLAAEIGGVCLALQLVTGIRLQWWALPVALGLWLLLWKGTFAVIEKGVACFGLITVVFIVGALKLHPPLRELGLGLLPTLPSHDKARYWFMAVSILGASITPYLMYFYASGAIEDQWDTSDLGLNRFIASLGMSFGSVISVGVLVIAALVFRPRGIDIEHYEQMVLLLTGLFGHWGVVLFAASLGIACFGAAAEVSLTVAYVLAQGFGWNWSENLRPKEEARFSMVYTVVILLAALLMALGIDLLTLTNVSMVLTAASLPLAIMPFLLLMNDESYVGEHRNGWFSNSVVVFIIALACVVALVSIPLQIFGG